ncbi:cytochrome P450 4C1 [Trichonephila inaurata madagascariensis]|uniref:Cytochrome P450 4C1 n=1 Tax=Trichonephila inaurata madagascariensis TaxID=2747483 RepID=A0A8X7CNS2_9ARAC|nr:cytochrome P450 4C1 [Trichonephila inaurata madagascariensis]
MLRFCCLLDILQRITGFNLLHVKEGFHCIWFGPNPVITMFSPEVIELVLSSSISLEKSFEYSFLQRWLGLGLLTSTGTKWKSRRKLLTPSFHFKILDDFLPTFNDQSMFLVKKLESLQHKEYVDITPLVILCTLDIVCETVMGASIGAQKGENIEYVSAVHNLGNFFNQRTVRPWLWLDCLFSLSSSGRGFDKDLHVVHSFTEKVIREKKEERNNKPLLKEEVSEDDFKTKKRLALMDLLLDLHMNEQQLTENDIKEEVDTFMFEGHDTTAMGIAFALYCIGLDPGIQEKIHEELDAIFGEDHERHITMDDARNMKYLECTLKESQRLYPSVPMIGRKLNEDIHYKHWMIPKGTTLHCNIHTYTEGKIYIRRPKCSIQKDSCQRIHRTDIRTPIYHSLQDHEIALVRNLHC